ncbi:unnamed protein product [Gongylonema pulchrum]|uniref:Aa_trans domain-containing protein n=1 Tax=Gongylonema pulchrum TaxID=637853 RepID=A0A183CYD9_9BILA|nr:unnamed protein product [Gongylonema pulchrum]
MFPVVAVFMKAPFPLVYRGIETILGFAILQATLSYFIGCCTMFFIELPFMDIEKTFRERRNICQDGHAKEAIGQLAYISATKNDTTRDSLLSNK